MEGDANRKRPLQGQNVFGENEPNKRAKPMQELELQLQTACMQLGLDTASITTASSLLAGFIAVRCTF